MPRIGDHAAVVGASMGGLLAARVLADAYRRVTIVERDPLPQSGSQRKGVPQGRHAHGLLPRGAQILDELFPGLLTAWRPVASRWCVARGSSGSSLAAACCARTANRASRATCRAGRTWRAGSATGSGRWATSRSETDA